jgi:hypothetical protein
MSPDFPQLIRFLTLDLKFRLRRRENVSGYDCYVIDLSGWKLRLSDRTPFIHVEKQHLESLSTADLVAAIRLVIRNQHFDRRVPILMVDGRSPELRDAVNLHLPYCALLDASDMESITGTASDRRMLDLLATRLLLGTLSPYEISSPVTGSRFFGREYEMRTILGHPDTDYSIVGVRRIGKSSLLLELKKRLEEMGDDNIFFFDCTDFHSAGDYIRAVVTEVDIKERSRMTYQKFPTFLRYKSYRGRRTLTFLLDEVDHLIQFDRRENWALMNTLRSSSNQGFCRYIMTGYREVVEESLKLQSPLYNFATRLPLGNLSREETRRLVTVPMENLGVSLDHGSNLVAQIFQQTAGHPNFVQFYCYSLVQLMDRQARRRIGPDDLALVRGDQEFERYVFRTFTANTTDLEKAIVYGMVLENSDQFNARDIDIALKKRKVFLSARQIEEACDNLRMSGVLDGHGPALAFAIPILNRLLKDNYDVDHLFAKAREDGRL